MQIPCAVRRVIEIRRNIEICVRSRSHDPLNGSGRTAPTFDAFSLAFVRGARPGWINETRRTRDNRAIRLHTGDVRRELTTDDFEIWSRDAPDFAHSRDDRKISHCQLRDILQNVINIEICARWTAIVWPTWCIGTIARRHTTLVRGIYPGGTKRRDKRQSRDSTTHRGRATQTVRWFRNSVT